MVMLFLIFCIVIVVFMAIIYNLDKVFNYFFRKIKKDKKLKNEKDKGNE